MATFGLDAEGRELAKAKRRKPRGLAGEAPEDDEDEDLFDAGSGPLV